MQEHLKKVSAAIDKLLAADVNGDGVVDELDLKMILSMIETKQKGVK